MVKKNPRLKAIVLQIVEKQLEDNEPPETKATLRRLVGKGHKEDRAKELIGCVVTTVIYDVLKNEQKYDRQKYIKALNKLPKLPWE
jgi:hypothetical protein